MTAKTPAHEQWQQCHCYKGNNASSMHNEHLMCTFFLLGWIGFLSKTTLSHPSQQEKKGLDEGNCTGSSMMPINCVCHWSGWVEVASPPEEEPHWQFWSGHKPYLNFSMTFLYFVLFTTRNIFSGGKRVSRSKISSIKQLNRYKVPVGTKNSFPVGFLR
jgi:hypothetical protein